MGKADERSRGTQAGQRANTRKMRASYAKTATTKNRARKVVKQKKKDR